MIHTHPDRERRAGLDSKHVIVHRADMEGLMFKAYEPIRLSRRNLLTLLHKLQMPGSACTIIKPGGTPIVAQSDEVHYAGRQPGPAHPETEAFIADFEKQYPA